MLQIRSLNKAKINALIVNVVNYEPNSNASQNKPLLDAVEEIRGVGTKSLITVHIHVTVFD